MKKLSVKEIRAAIKTLKENDVDYYDADGNRYMLLPTEPIDLFGKEHPNEVLQVSRTPKE